MGTGRTVFKLKQILAHLDPTTVGHTGSNANASLRLRLEGENHLWVKYRKGLNLSGLNELRISVYDERRVSTCELQQIDITNKPPEFLKISPIGKVPVLVDEDGTTLWDSTLIMEYLDETYPKPSFYPSEPSQRLQCRLWEDLADTLGDNIVALWLQNRKGDKADPSDKAKYQAIIDRLLPILDQQLTTSDYLLGSTWTAADVAAVSALGYYTLRFGEEWQQQYLKLGKWFAQLHQHDSVKSTIPVA